MIFETKSGSTYELDEAGKRVRRISGKKDPAPRQGKDGEWKVYSNIFPDPIVVGRNVFIFWTKDVPLLEETPEDERDSASPATVTSQVVSIS